MSIVTSNVTSGNQIDLAEHMNSLNMNKINVSLTDSKGDLKLYHYDDTYPGLLNETTGWYRGVIYRTKTDDYLQKIINNITGNEEKNRELDVVCRSYPYCREVLVGSSDVEIEKFVKDADDLRVYLAHEGTIIRVFYTDEWHLSTHKKIDAYNSRWAGDNFGTIFEDCLRSSSLDYKGNGREDLFAYFDDNLSKEKCYVFLAANHPGNRITTTGRPFLLHLTTLIDNCQRHEEPIESVGIPFASNKNKEYSLTYDNILTIVTGSKCGVILQDGNEKQLRVISPDYYDLVKLRGNQPSIRFRYLQLRCLFYKLEVRQLQQFARLYYEYMNVFVDVEKEIFEFIKHLYRCYVDRYINRKQVIVSKSEHWVLKSCHKIFIEAKSEGRREKITFQHVERFVNILDPPSLNKCLKMRRSKQEA